VNGGKEVVDAVQAGKDGAISILKIYKLINNKILDKVEDPSVQL
jgi:hypothetical protein